MSAGQIGDVEQWAEDNGANGLPLLVLPSGDVTITQCATNLFNLIAPTKRLFVRGGAVVILGKRDDGLLDRGALLAIDHLRAAARRARRRRARPPRAARRSA